MLYLAPCPQTQQEAVTTANYLLMDRLWKWRIIRWCIFNLTLRVCEPCLTPDTKMQKTKCSSLWSFQADAVSFLTLNPRGHVGLKIEIVVMHIVGTSLSESNCVIDLTTKPWSEVSDAVLAIVLGSIVKRVICACIRRCRTQDVLSTSSLSWQCASDV